MKDLLMFITVIGLAVFGVKSCSESEWYQASEREREAQERAERTPHVVREADGCKVYAFKAGEWHYFTRCPQTTTTDTSIKRTCGKNCTKTEIKSIETNNG